MNVWALGPDLADRFTTAKAPVGPKQTKQKKKLKGRGGWARALRRAPTAQTWEGLEAVHSQDAVSEQRPEPPLKSIDRLTS